MRLSVICMLKEQELNITAREYNIGIMRYVIGYDYKKSIFIFQNAKTSIEKHEILLDHGYVIILVSINIDNQENFEKKSYNI